MTLGTAPGSLTLIFLTKDDLRAIAAIGRRSANISRRQSTMSYPPARLILTLGLLSCVSTFNGRNAAAADDDRERQVMERFLTVLERTPRRGTALDRVYGFHVEQGELDKLVQSYRERAAKDPRDGGAWLLLGLLESQRGRDAAAVVAFRAAEETRPEDPLPSYYLGQALVLVGQPDAAVEAFERALTRKPTRNDLLEIFQALGRVHQRARRDEQALSVWTRLEKVFPDDPRVREQIASSLAEEGRIEPALARYEALASSSLDPYRRVRFQLEAADLKVKLGRQGDALRDYEELLAGLEPESWLFREVRRKIEDVFNRDDDQAGLVKYYERWVEKSPDDVDAMARLGKTLAAQGRAAEARSWLDKALKLSPSSKGLRLALIEQLAQERKFAEAAAQFEAMAKVEPYNPDIVRDWGRMLLRDSSKPEADRKAAAAKVWRKLVDARPDDPSTAAQVADLSRQAGLADEAISLYQKAIDLGPESPQYREYLGEYYHQLKRPLDAQATWRGIAEGVSRTPVNLERLGDVLANFGYKSEAIETVGQAITLDPASYSLRLRQGGLLLDARRFEEAEAQLVAAESLADDVEHREEVLDKRISVDEASGRIPFRIDALKVEVTGPKAGDASTWRRLARYAEAARRPVEATAAAEKAVALDGSSVASKATLARLYEATGRFGEAAEVARVLATLDRRARVEHLTKVAELEARLGRKDEALSAGRDVLAATPGNPESLQFHSNLCFQLGETEEGLNTLRRAVRSNESDVPALTSLAEALAREFRTEEAIELFWKAFERSSDLDSRRTQVARLADLHLRRNQFDRLTARLERLQAEDGKRREATFFLAQAYASLGDFGTARRQLEALLEGNARDTALLKQLSELAEAEGDMHAALKFQQQRHEVAPDGESARRLVGLAIRAGDIEFAEALWAKTTETDTGQDLARVMSALDSLASNGRFEAVLATTNRLLRADPANWEALYREAKALLGLGRLDEASSRFLAILDLRRNDDELSAAVKDRLRMARRSATSILTSDQVGAYFRINSATTRIRGISGLTPGYPSNLMNNWPPGDFGQVRVAALAHELARARRAGTEAEWLASQRQATGRTPNDPRLAWDELYLANLLNEPKATYEAARDLVRAVGHDASADIVLLMAAATRSNLPSATGQVARTVDASTPDQTPPLPPQEVDLIRDAYRSLQRVNSSSLNPYLVLAATTELKRAGRIAEFEPDYRALIDLAKDVQSYYLAGYFAAERGDLASLRKATEAFYRLPVGIRSGQVSPSQPYVISTPQGALTIPEYNIASGMKAMADTKRYGEILQLVDDQMAAIQDPSRVAQRQKASQSTSLTAPFRNAYPIFTYPDGRVVVGTLDYPTPNRHLDYGSIMVLRTAFTFFKRDDRVGELTSHLRKGVDLSNDPSTERHARLALSAALWWSDDRDGSLRELARALELTPGDLDLKFLMAEVHSMRKELEEALAVVDSVEAVDQEMTRRRELLALRLSVQAVRPERARQAAERLFGLRLDSAAQIQLAAQMQQLGMLDLADAVLARTRRQAGNNPSALLELMAQYRRQGNLDAASQIALDLVRRSTGQALRTGLTEDPSQKQAIDVLASSGKLKEMIEKVEGQVRISPRSLPLQQTLAAYYRAAGRLDKLKSTNEAILKLRPEDTSLRMQVATQLAQAGDLDSALDHYRAVFQHDPSMLSTYSAAILNTFQQANRLDEFIKLLDQVGLKTFNDTVSIRTLIGTLCNDPKTLDQGITLLRKAQDAYPDYGMGFLAAVISIDPFWARPEAYDFAIRSVLPREDAAVVEPWAGLDWAISTQGYGRADGRIATVATRVLDIATRQGKLDEFVGSVESRLARHPGWLAGQALLGSARLRQGRVKEGRGALEKVISAPAAQRQFEALLVLGQETRDVPVCGLVAIAAYELACKNERALTMASLYMQSSPFRQLALLYGKAGRAKEGVALALKTEEGFRGLAISANAPLNAYRQLASLVGLGSLYLDLNDPADALRVLHEVLASPDDIQVARAYPVRNILPSVDVLLAPASEAINRALNGLTHEMLPLTFESLVKPNDPNRPVDLQLVVHPRELDKATIRSLLLAALELASRDPATLSKVKADLDSIVRSRPGDFEVRAAIALLTPLGDQPGGLASAAIVLDRLADESPLPPLPTGARSDARTRDEAARRLGLWLVARRCWQLDSTAEVGDRLAAKGLEAARRQADPAWAMTMLRELGQRALDRGDRPGAEARFASLLALVQQDALAQGPSAPPTRPTPAGRPTPPGTRGRMPVLMVGKFRQAAEFAALASGAGMADLSFKAIRDALRGGPPILPATMSATAMPVRVVAGAPVDMLPDPAIVLVESKLIELDALWAKGKVPPEVAYEVLRDVVLPPARPSEIFLYDPATTLPARPSAADDSPRPGELASLLARRARLAGRLDDLRGKVAERKDSPAARDAARQLLAAIEETSKE
jgi:tetratricopeptide (TPR) repeat protein